MITVLPLVMVSWALIHFVAGPSLAAAESALLPGGTYRLEMRTVSRTKVPMVGWNRSEMVSVSLVQLRWDGAVGAQTHEVCSLISRREGAVVKLVFPKRYVASLSRPHYGIQLMKNGKGWEYHADLGNEYVGYHPERNGGELPGDANDPAIYDWDGDERPGATLRLSIPLFPDGKLYVLQRGHQILNGKVLTPGRVEGKIDVRVLEQRVIGAKPSFLNHTPEVVPDSNESIFTMTRVPDGTSCASLEPKVDPPADEGDTDYLSD